MPRRSRSRSRSRSPRKERERRRDRERKHRRRSRSRSRSRSAPRYRSRSRSAPRYRSRSRSPPRYRSRSRSPRGRYRSRSRSPGRKNRDRRNNMVRSDDSDEEVQFIMEEKPHDTSQLTDKTDEEKEMFRVMGFLQFDTTKEKPVNKKPIYVANIVHKRKYRQYMNRRGGFNRPLDFIA
ncbi:Hypothetical predicted protein [Octopus vulgaris]|uniref:Uncharacterized protein n=3 Tax=Octopus TaxID=6643 RepID=A0AA36BR51_OCTVU|nr:U4/U6.U5 small nuclear ribonucleoprotein 27 kDa protein isoform X1 [Octopus bimaculoides]XP_029649689.1 U4/U6.U5 small nuclear ribonucleoprotein 27 kDa protein isoform X1 [Octopus sinensis]CAI9738733.1 Hypothetical predicted protein [Octopus vulgaris]|eukprot:XP_014781398.1 PREDICTED: U4/U6.U5 small nuclear ribonucleoprotein 27 kDa protein-like isoform X1 [Octopus bimaculoides]